VPPDGGGRGHFTTVAELREAVTDHEKRIAAVERDVLEIADRVFGGRMVKRTRRPKPRSR